MVIDMSERVEKDGKFYEPCVMGCNTFVEKGSVDYPYCGRECFEGHLSQAVEPASCQLHERIVSLRDDAERRVRNIESIGTNKLETTKSYFQARADVLNDLLVVMDGNSMVCSC